MSTDNTKKFLTPYDIADMMNVCYQKALAFIKYSGIKYVKIGRTYRVDESVLIEFLKKSKIISVE